MLRVRCKCVATNTNKPTPPAPVILGLVPRIFWQQGTNLVNKLALLLHKCWFTQDSRNKSENDECWGRGFSMVISKQRSVAFCNKIMDTRLPQPAGCGDKYDVSGCGFGHMFSAFCMFFKYPSPDAKASPSPARGEGFGLLRRYTPRNDAVTNGEGLHHPWCDKILGTGPSMTGSRGANSFGRSMIEMLGVLAIIGVLSVGGIAGYSKAMEKFKVNKTVSEYSNFIFGILEHLSDYQNLTQVDDGKQISLANTINNTVSVPPNWVLNGGFSDSNGNQLYIVSRNNRLVLDIYMGTISINDKGQFVSDNFSTNLCRELFLNLVQPIADTLYWARLYRANEAVPVKFWGNKTCNGADRKCLQAITLSEIDATCKLCVKGDYCCIGLEF